MDYYDDFRYYAPRRGNNKPYDAKILIENENKEDLSGD
jgi:hypothetical protein